MQIEALTYSVETAISIYSSQQISQGQQTESVEEPHLFEPSQQVLGAAESLPGQGSERAGFQVDGRFGFCENCGTLQVLLSGRDNGTLEVNGVEIPDLHALGEEAAAVTAASEAEESEADDADGAGEELVERDPMTGEAELTEEEKQEVEEFKRRNQEVRTHEHAHVAAGGQYVRGGIQYEYQTGPDGKRYAVGGEVSIDTSPESDPEDTIRKAQIIRQAALAPAEPSGQDRRAAAAAVQMEMKARQEMVEEKLEGGEEGDVGEVEDILAVAGVGEAAGDMGSGNESEDLDLGEGSKHTSDESSLVHEEHSAILVEGLEVSKKDDEDGLAVGQKDGNGLSVENKDSDDEEGLPEVSSSASQPVTRLEYGQHREAGQLVDVFG